MPYIRQKSRDGIKLFKADKNCKSSLLLQIFLVILLGLCPINILAQKIADNIDISHTQLSLEQFSIAYLSDPDKQLTLSQVIKSNDFIISNNKVALGLTIKPTWYKLILVNQGLMPKNIFLHNKIAYMSRQIDIYEFQDNRQLDQNRYLLSDPQIGEKLMGSSLVYPISILPGKQKTLYIKNQGVAQQLVNFALYDQKNSNQSLINKNFYSNILVIIIFTLALYNLFLFMFSRKKEFFFYFLYLINISLGLFYMYGSIFHHLNLYGENIYWFNLTAILVPFFLMLFVQSIFNTRQTSTKLNYGINLIIFLSLVNVLFALFFSLDIALLLNFFVFFLSFFLLIFLIIHYYQQKNRLIGIFSLAYMSYIIGIGIVLLLFLGFIPYNFFTLHASGIGIVIEALLFSYLLYYHTKLLEEEIATHKHALILKQKKSQMGEMISAISHQWKQPITAISSITTLLHFKLQDNNQISMLELKKKLSQIDEKIFFLNETLNSFRSFFNSEKNKQSCDVGKVIDNAISIMHEEMLSETIILKSDYNFDRLVEINQNELLHIILNLLQNSREAFKNRADLFLTNKQENKSNTHQTSKMIKIMGKMQADGICIDIIDNAGGIKESDLPYIFDEFYSNKAKDQGSGLGLYLSRFILEKHMNGSINACNVDNGTLFSIKINI